MANDAWADDPDLRILTDDDPDSVRMKVFLARWLWPGIGGLAIVTGMVVLFKLSWAVGPLKAAALFWLVAQFIVRPGKFVGSVAGFFAKASGLMAKYGAPVIAWLNANARSRRAKPQPSVQAFAAVAAAAASEPEAQPAPEPRARINWAAGVDGLLKWWWLIALIVAAIILFSMARDLFDGPSGREVAAEYRAEAAENITRTTEAEAERSAESVVIVERHNERSRVVADQVEEAREAIAEAPDLDAQFVEYRSHAERLRDEAGAATAAAVSEYHSSLDP